MSGRADQVQEPVRARIPADLDTPDRVAFGMTVRQLLVVGAFAGPIYLAWQGLVGVVPLPVLAGTSAPVAAVAMALAVGRRDGLPLDAWLLAALAHARRPRRLSPSGHTDDTAGGAGGGRTRIGVLRLPASRIDADGVISAHPANLSGNLSRNRGRGTSPSRHSAALVAVSTITSGLHTVAEQSALLGGYGRWLNGLSGPVQVVVSSRPVDLPGRALRIAQDATRLYSPVLAQAAVEHAEHLLDLCADGDPRARTITIACTAEQAGEALRRAERTASALTAIGAKGRVLDGAEATGVLAAAVDVHGPAGAWSRTPPDATVTSTSTVTGRTWT